MADSLVQITIKAGGIETWPNEYMYMLCPVHTAMV